MQLSLIKNPDNTQAVLYKLARVVYAETLATSLRKVEMMSSLIYNVHIKYQKSFDEIANDKNLFSCLDKNSERNKFLSVNANTKKFQMCLRIVNDMCHGKLPDYVCGATKFHHCDVIPDWAMARGYISECENILFYL